MSRTSQITRTARETVSLETLESKLPKECWQAICNHLSTGGNTSLDDSVYHAYFNAEAVPVLSEPEKSELFETLGSELVKGHYSTEQLRSFLEKEPIGKKRR